MAKAFFSSFILLFAGFASLFAQPEPPLNPGYTSNMKVGYLLNENFWALNTYRNKDTEKPSGWETNSQGSWDNDGLTGGAGFFTSFKLIDSKADDGVMIRKCIAAQHAGKVTFEYRFMMPGRMDGVTWQLRSGLTPAVTIVTDNGNLSYETSTGGKAVLRAYDANREYGVRVVADITANRASIYIDGTLQASNVAFCNAVDMMNYVYIKTGNAATGDLYLSPVDVHKGYSVREKFVTTGTGNIPGDWTKTTSGGTVGVDAFHCSPRPDVFSMKLNDTSPSGNVSLSNSFSKIEGQTEFWYSFLLPAKKDGMTAELKSGSTTGVKITTSGGNICYINSSGNPVTIVPSYLANLWYSVKIVADPGADKADIYINGKLKHAKVSLHNKVTHFDNMVFTTSNAQTGIMWVDDVKVYPHQGYPADYPAEPVPAAHSPYIIGVQSCNLWKEGQGYSGWDWIYPSANIRKPLLGWYDDGKPEVVDWEIKWQVEHGIDFELHCWYRSPNAFGKPIKRTPFDHGIVEGLFNARYKRYKKFMIMWEDELFGHTNSDDFRKNIVPYWVEYFLKDPSYLKVDNKPILSFYLNTIGNITAADLDYLRQQCIKAGFAGIIYLHEHRGNGNASALKNLGIDYSYAYCRASYGKLESQRNNAATVPGFGIIPSINNGWNTTPWDGGAGGSLKSSEAYRAEVELLKNTFLPTMPANELGSKMVLMGNWNEFGEGHYLMPSAERRFEHLDAIRTVFTKGPPSRVVPNAAQKNRINVLYPKDNWTGEPFLPGCMDSDYEEYDLRATVEDPSACKTLGANPPRTSESVNIGPDFIVIRASGPHAIQVFNLNNRIVRSIEGEGEKDYALSTFFGGHGPGGIYIVKVKTQKGIFTRTVALF